ncbi:uncharacterized protein LOC126899827 [Daktulosphaira vitifoliae]|uniref:uncharacterized protein LOC126899827 n=1 Tax=Daktulosphaira vitifoliae TaxID=58002 RepID=UPI0021AAA3DE|nr:uncharacterized protein LOC126899827 [Daktulosphaira vitifoliae]
MVNRCVLCFATIADGVSLHKFPRDAQRADSWLQFIVACGRNPSDVNVRNAFLCYRHFLPSDYGSSTVRRVLNRNAVPSVSITEQHDEADIEIVRVVDIDVGDAGPFGGNVVAGGVGASGNDLVEVVEVPVGASPEIVDVGPLDIEVVGAPVEPSPEFVDVGLEDVSKIIKSLFNTMDT